MYLTLFLLELFFTVCNSGRPWVSWLKWQRYRVASEKWFRHCKVLWWTVRNVYIVEASIGKWWCFFSPNQAIIVSATVLSMCFYFLSFFPDPSFFSLFVCVCVFFFLLLSLSQVKEQVKGKGLYTTVIIATKTLQGRSVSSVSIALILTYV